MSIRGLLAGLAVLGAGVAIACLDESILAPDDVLPPVPAVDRPTVQLFRFARGRKVEADTVRITNNGEGPLGVVEQVGGVDYITEARTGWLRTTIENLGDDQALLILRPSYAEDEQEEADIAEVVLKADRSPDLKRVRVIARTLRGAVFEFSVRPMAFAAVPGDTATIQRLVVRNGGNGTLLIHPPAVHYAGVATGWLSVARSNGSEAAPEYEVRADPEALAGGLHQAFLVFASPPEEEARAKADSIPVLLNVGQPVLSVSAPTLAFTMIRGAEDPPAQSVLLSNGGEGVYGALGDVSVGATDYGDGPDGWLAMALAGAEVTVSVRSAGLGAGDYEASFPVVSGNGGTKNVQVLFSMKAPILTPSSQTVSFGMVQGGGAPPQQTVAITNTGSGTLAALGPLSLGSPAPSASWLETDLVGDTIFLTPTAVAKTLAAGDYATRLPLHSAYGGSDTLSVTLSVSRSQDPPKLALSATKVDFSGISGDPSPSPREVQVSNAGGGTLGTLSAGTISYPGTGGWLSASLAGSAVTLTAVTGTLPDGTHLATVPVSSTQGGDASIDVTFSIGSPILTASATSVSFSAAEGGDDPSDRTVTLSNTGPGTFASLGAISVGTVTYGGPGGWLSASYAGGTLTLAATTGALSAGTYTATVPVASVEGGSVSIGATFTVARTTDPADLVASPSSVRMDAVQGGGDPPAQTVLLANAGGGTLGALGVSGITYGGGASGWLSASLAGSTLTLGATTGSLASGSHGATVGLTSDNGGTASVAVTFVVGAPTLTLSARSVSFSAQEGGATTPASRAVDLSNTGAGDFGSLGTITVDAPVYGTGAGWVTAGLDGSGTRVDLSTDAGGLTAGTYTATVPVGSTAGGSASIAVTLTVSPPPADPVLALSATGVGFSATEGGADPASQGVVLSNSGGGDLAALGALSLGTISYGGGSGWLSASLAGATVTLSVTTGSLTAAGGPYTATVPVQSANGGSRNVGVTFTVSVVGDAPDLKVSPGAVRLDAVAGGASPPGRDVVLYNGGDGSLGALSVVGTTYGSGAGWLATSLAGSTLTLTGDVSGLDAGSYTAAVEVASANGGNATVGVTLVLAQAVLSLSASSASFSGPEGGSASPAGVSVSLSNTGAGDFASLGTVSLGPTSYGGAGGWLSAGLAGGDARVDLSAALGALSAGTYTASVPVNTTQGGTGSISVTLTVSRTVDAPSLALSTSSVAFTALLGGGSPAPKTVTISNDGGGTLVDLGTLGIGTISYGGGDTGWLSSSSLAGSILTLSPVTGSLAAGSHTASVQVTSEFGGSRSVAVTVTVASPILTASTRGLSFTGLVDGAAPGGQTVTFSNTGAGTYGDLGSVTVGAIGYGAGASEWLAAPAAGASAGGGTLDFSVDHTGLAAGRYTATVPVASQFGGSESITVTLSVVRTTDPPSMVLSSTTQRFDALVGGADPPAQEVFASNAGGGSLGTVQVGPPAYGGGATGWLAASVSGNTISTRASTGSLDKGTWTASVPVSSDGGAASIDVTFVVGTSRLTLSPRAVSFGDTVGGAGPAPATVAIANTGGGSFASLGTVRLGPTVYAEGASDWLDATLSAPATVRVTAITGGLSSRADAYQARVPVLSTLGGSDSIVVSFTVAPGTSPPRLTLSLDSMVFGGILGGDPPAAQTVSATNTGGGELGALSLGAIDYGDGAQGWLVGEVSGPLVTLRPIVDGLPGGTHRAEVTIASEHGGERRMVVSLVLAPPVLSLSSRSVTFSDTIDSSDTLHSQVFISNAGAGNRASLGLLNVGTIAYPQGRSGWLSTRPGAGEVVEGFVVGLDGSASALPEGSWTALVPVESRWGGVDTVAVTFAARVPDRSFDLPTIELVKDSLVNGAVVQVPLAGDSVVVGPFAADASVRLGVRNASETRVTLSGLRVGVPTYPGGEQGGWITGAFLDRTTATYDDPAELVVVVSPRDLTSGRHEGRLVISSESAGLEAVSPRVLRVILVAR